MEGVLKIKIDALSTDLGCLPPTQQNFLIEESSNDSSNESNIEKENKEGRNIPTMIEGLAM